MLRRLELLLGLMLLFLLASVNAQNRSTDESASRSLQVQTTAERFVEAFADLDWERFRAFFADDATAFFPPSANLPVRVDGKNEIEKVFKTFFEKVKTQKPRPPYLTIEPKQLKIQILGDVALVTFHLEDPGMFGRRTLVLRKIGRNWRIVHLHASGVPS